MRRPLSVPAFPASPYPEEYDALADAVALLGPCAPLPALFEEVVRDWRGLPTRTDRLHQLFALNAAHQSPGWPVALAALMTDTEIDWDIRVLAAILLAVQPSAPPPPAPGDASAETLYAFAAFTRPGALPWYMERLEAVSAMQRDDPLAMPGPLPLLCFLAGLRAHALSDEQFAACVTRAGVLHPAVSAHRPWRRLHRLLDYLGLSDDPQLPRVYRRLVAEIWPGATARNWSSWHWVTVPGGPDLFPRALTALQDGERTIVRLHELKYAPLPRPAALYPLLATATPAALLLLHWLRPALPGDPGGIPGGRDALHWLMASNQAAAATAYAGPPWWESWCAHGMPAAREALGWLLEMELPPEGAASMATRARWLESYLLPDYRRLCANLLLAQAASGERLDEIIGLAAEGDLPAMRALALAPQPDARILALLQSQRRQGGRPTQAAAGVALEHLAHRQGLPNGEELERQQLLAAAWELGPLAGERVRVGWEIGGYRLRLSVRDGKVRCEVLGPRGPVARIPAAVRQSEPYQEARAAQREAQGSYRLFKTHLERCLVEARPISSGEFRYLFNNPLFASLAERLVWLTSRGDSFLWAGPERWETADGRPCSPFRADDAPLTLLVAHPVMLAETGSLIAWQLAAARHRLTQPFKQLFREFYICAGEQGDTCARFAGRPLDPRRAYALLRAAGFAPGAGVARREWPAGVTAHCCWAQDATGRDLFGPHRPPLVTSGEIWFTRGEEALPLAQVDPVLFSETLRAADLLTAHAAPNAADLSARETIALRAVVLREAARTFGLTNLIVREEGPHALVLGAHATYRVHLANAAIFLEPEGRQLTLPRDDPRWQPEEGGDATAEVLAVVLALTQDHQITDLSFLAQLSPA